MALKKQTLNIAVALLVCFAIVLVIFTFVPLTPVDINGVTEFQTLREIVTGEPPFTFDNRPTQIPDEPTACIEVFMPVCGVDGETYSNQCFLDVAGVELDHEGAC